MVIIRRILAWIVDWNLSLLPCFIYTTILKKYFVTPSFDNVIFVLFLMALIILSFVAFVFRDVIFKGRSIGKRIFGLYVIDKNTNEQASVKKRIVRNLFFQIYFVDGIILICTKRSIGEIVTNTIVQTKSIRGRFSD